LVPSAYVSTRSETSIMFDNGWSEGFRNWAIKHI